MDRVKVETPRKRFSRRKFVAMCPIALAPAAWFALDGFGSVVNRSLDFLRLRYDQDDAFDFQGGGDVAVTALVMTAVLRGGKGKTHSAANGMKHLEKYVQSDGGIYTPSRRLEHYETCLAAACFAEANVNRRYDSVLRNATAFIKACQWDERKGHNKEDMVYGGTGYGRRCRPDLLNTSFLLDAVKSDAAAQNDPSIEKTLVFITRCQNVDDSSGNGGFRSCASGGRSNSGVMTMIGLKSLLAAGVARNDDRIKAAIAWIRNHYDMASNPGMGNAGLYHYFHVCAETLLALGMDEFEDAAGVKHNWRKELSAEIVRRQRRDGSWGNENGCWMENDPHTATAHALLALSYCEQPSAKTA